MGIGDWGLGTGDWEIEAQMVEQLGRSCRVRDPAESGNPTQIRPHDRLTPVTTKILYVGLLVRLACSVAGRTDSPTYEWLFSHQLYTRKHTHNQ